MTVWPFATANDVYVHYSIATSASRQLVSVGHRTLPLAPPNMVDSAPPGSARPRSQRSRAGVVIVRNWSGWHRSVSPARHEGIAGSSLPSHNVAQGRVSCACEFVHGRIRAIHSAPPDAGRCAGLLQADRCLHTPRHRNDRGPSATLSSCPTSILSPTGPAWPNRHAAAPAPTRDGANRRCRCLRRNAE